MARKKDKRWCFSSAIIILSMQNLLTGRRFFYCYKKEFYDVKTFFMRDPTVTAG